MSDKPNILLDLDQTLISAEPTEEYDFKKNKNKAEKFVFHDMDGYYIVFERPGLQKLLAYLFDNYNVSVWTAASKDYALYVINKIILGKNSNRKLDYIFFSYHCDVSKALKNGSKDLSVLWDIYALPGYDQKNTVILDDYDEVHKTQPGNCIIAKAFEFTDDDSENDNFLENLISKLRDLKDSVNSGKDIGPVVEEMNSSGNKVIKPIKKGKFSPKKI